MNDPEKKKEKMKMSKKENMANPDKLGAKNLFLWSANGGSAAVQVVLLGNLSMYLTNALGMNVALVGTLLMASKAFDGITDLIAGYVVDKTNTKLGRGRPYDLCIIGLWLTTWMLFAVPEGFTTTVKCVYVFICYTLCQSIFKTFMTAGATPYMVRAFNNEQKYVKLNSWGGMISTVCVMVFNVVFPTFYAKVLYDPAGWRSLVGFIAIPLCIIGILRFFFIPEKYEVDAKNEHTTLKDVINLLKDNRQIYPIAILQFVVGIAGSLSVTGYYFQYIVGNIEISGVMSIFTIFAMLTLIVYPALLKKITTKQLIQYALLLSVVSGLLSFAANDNLILLAVAGVILGVVQLPASYMFGLLIIDCADFNEWEGRARMEGTLASITGFANKIGTAFSTFFAGLLLGAAGFVSGADTQSDSAILMIRVCYALVPMAFYLLAAFALKYFKIDKMKPQINADLAERRKKISENGGEN